MKKAPKGFTAVIDGEYPMIDEGAKVIINSNYVWEGESPKKYFICELNKGHCLIADNKREYNEGRGTIYSIWSIDYYQNF